VRHATCRLANFTDNVVAARRIDRHVGAKIAGVHEPFRAGVERDHPRAERVRTLRRRQPERPLAEDRDGLVGGQVEPLQRLPAVPVPQRASGA